MIHIDPKGYIRSLQIIEYYRDKKHDFIFDKCKSLNGKTRLWESTPRFPYIEDQITIRETAPIGSTTVSLKERQIQWTWTQVKCDVHDMLSKLDFTSYWHSITEEHAKDVLKRAEGVVNHFDFELPEDFKQFTSIQWEIKSLNNKLGSFTKNPKNITGKYPDVYNLDEVAKYDPQSLFEEVLAEANAALMTGKLFVNSTTKKGNTFEDMVVSIPLVGMSYESHLGTFKIPTREEWAQTKRRLQVV